MAGVNKVIILGNLTKDPETRFMPNGGAVSNITVATSEKWKDKQTGEQKEKAEFHRVVMFGKLAEIAGEYLRKGSKVYIEGQLQTRKWTNNDGVDQWTTEIVVQGFNGTMQMLSPNPNAQQGGGHQQQSPNQGAQQQGGGFQGQQQGGFQNQTANQQQGGGYQQQAAQQGGFKQQQSTPKVNPQEPNLDFDDDIIPF